MLGLHCAGESTAFQFALGGIGVFREGSASRSPLREYFPDQPPYCAFDACGLRFVKWNGGGDGMIDAAQEKWIMDECAKCPKDKQLVVLVHQPRRTIFS